VRENLGAEVYLYTDYAGNQLTARVEPTSTAIVGDEIKMVLDKNKIHVFDKATEKSLHTVTAQEMEKYKNI
jgi:multiple sugar transport system ATP-binding protein